MKTILEKMMGGSLEDLQQQIPVGCLILDGGNIGKEFIKYKE